MRTVLITFIVLLCLSINAQVIPSNRMIPWIPNQTIGVVGGIISRTNAVVDVTKSPYNADNTGATSAQSAIQSAVNAATNGEVLYFPAGIYDITANNGIIVKKNNITLRGAGSNTMLVGQMVIGPGISGNYAGTGWGGWVITNGAAIGSTSVSFSTLVDVFGQTLTAGDSVNISSYITSDSSVSNGGGFQYISTLGGEPGAQHFGQLNQMVVITNITGNVVQFTPPLAWWFTNQPTAGPLNQVGGSGSSFQATYGVGIENLTLTTSNATLRVTPFAMLLNGLVYNCWVTNCTFFMGNAYSVYYSGSANCYFGHNFVNWAQSVGSDHAGLLLDHDTGLLVEDSDFVDGLQPGIEIGTAFVGCALFGNFTTNTSAGLDIDIHDTFPVMDLFEENKCGETAEWDGKGGGAAYHTLFRNRFRITTPLKRWSTYFNIVGNVMGEPTVKYIYLSPNISGYPSITNYGVLEVGFPNEGNQNFSAITGPVSWNWPGPALVNDPANVQEAVFSMTNTQVNTNTLWGNFTNVPGINPGNYTIIGQEAANTNVYHFIGIPASGGTSSNVVLTAATSATNGWAIYVVNQYAWQWLQSSNINTFILTGNGVCTNQSTYTLVWDGNGVQPVTNSILYPSGPPSWWGTNNWPAVNPLGAPQIGNIPAGYTPSEERYLGIPSGNGGGGSPTPPKGLPTSLLF